MMADVIQRCKYAHCEDQRNDGNSSRPGGVVLQPLEYQRTKWRAYSKRRTRRKSFVGAAAELVSRAIYLAKMGFFFKGYGKKIVCFQCGLELEVKEGVGDYHSEHSTLAPQCRYVRQLNEDGQSDDSDAGEIDIQNNHQMTATTQTENNPFDQQSTLLNRHNTDQTYIYDSDDPLGIQNDHNIARDQDVSVSQDRYFSTVQRIDISISQDCGSTRQEQVTRDNQLTCKVCLNKQVSVTFRPCGHLATCRACADRLQKCPMCRTFIREKINTYLS